VVLPHARIDFGRQALTASELTAWGLAKPEAARALVRALDGAAQAERQAMLAPEPARTRRRGAAQGAGRGSAAATLARGWPREAVDAPEPVRQVLAAVARGLSHLGQTPSSPEARARLVGGVLGGAAVLGAGGADAGLRDMIRRRAGALFAEFRSLDQDFEFITVAGQPALALAESDEVWAGRALVLNAPPAGLSRVAGESLGALLPVSPPTRRRVVRHYRGPRRVFPDAMGDRVICLPDPAAGTQPPVVTLRRARSGGSDLEDLVAAAIAPADAPQDEMGAWIERVVRRLIPFAEAELRAQPREEPVWDTDALLCDPTEGGWPRAPASRISARPCIHQLDRAALGGLGFEGDLLLGLRAGDAIAEDLA
jgi:hypothetical protein